MGTHPIFESDFDCLTVHRMTFYKFTAVSTRRLSISLKICRLALGPKPILISTRYTASPKTQSDKQDKGNETEEVKSIWDAKPNPILPNEPKNFFGKGNFNDFQKDVGADVGKTTLFWAGLLFCCFVLHFLLRESNLVEKALYAGQ